MDMTLVFTTVDSEDAAQRLAQEAVQRHLAACVQVQAIRSTYRWQGQVRDEAEFRLMAKTTPQRAPELVAAWRASHPYEVPALWTVSAQSAQTRYAQWVLQETAPLP